MMHGRRGTAISFRDDELDRSGYGIHSQVMMICAALLSVVLTSQCSGSEFAKRIAPMPLAAREAEVQAQFTAGNVPDSWRKFAKVTVTRRIGSKDHTAVYLVSPDYLAIGSDADFLLMPVTPATAEALGDLLDCTLPTRRMVGDIHRAAAVKLSPVPLTPGPEMTTVAVFARHNEIVEKQRSGQPAGLLTSGHKKDIVLTPELAKTPGKVALFGWHRADGTAIQPLYTGHTSAWVDYSHGSRFVQRTMTVDGKATTVAAVLADHALCELLSDEGPFTVPRFSAAEFPGELQTELSFEPGVRAIINAPAVLRPDKPLRLVLYAAPAGNTIEQTFGRSVKPGGDWHFDIQHIAAQTRWLRQHGDDADLAVVCLQCAQQSWPAWRKAQDPDNRRLPGIITALRGRFAGRRVETVLSGHSAGGSFVFGYMDGVAAIPDEVTRIAFLDSNYAYSSARGHDAKFTTWLKGPGHYLCVLAYHDSIALLNGMTFVSEAGGTWGRSHAMQRDLAAAFPFTTGHGDSFERFTALEGRVKFLLRENPDKAVLHTRLVEWNGFIHSMLTGTDLEEKDYRYSGPRAYSAFISRK